MLDFNVKHLSDEIVEKLQYKIDNKIKPLHSLGKLEKLALQIGRIQNTLSPELKKPTMLVFAADHGVNEEGVSIFPQEVTYQMVLNFLQGGAGLSVFAKQHGMDIKVVDGGVKYNFTPAEGLIIAKIAEGTKNFVKEPAMTKEQCLKAVYKGAEILEDINKGGCNTVGFGEMGISNTSPSSVIFSILSGIPIEECVGRGAGITDRMFERKKEVLKKALKNNFKSKEPIEVLTTFGGIEIAMLVGAMLKAAELNMVIIIDGFITSSALLLASKICPDVVDYCIFSHKSKEQAHIKLLNELKADPILDLDLHLGEGTGAAIAYPIVESALVFLNNMSSYDDTGVSNVVE